MILHNEQAGKSCDIDYELLIKKKKASIIQNPENVFTLFIQYTTSDQAKIFVCVRKRPIAKKEIANGILKNKEQVKLTVYLQLIRKFTSMSVS